VNMKTLLFALVVKTSAARGYRSEADRLQ